MKLRDCFLGCLLAVSVVMPAFAGFILFSNLLEGGTDIPPNASPGTGVVTTTVEFDPDFNVFAMRIEAMFADLTGTTTAVKIHCCTVTPRAANVGVATMLPSFTGFPLGVHSGTYDRVFDMTLASSWNPAFVTAQGGIPNVFDALIAGLLRTSAIPEPGKLALLRPALAGLALKRTRQS